jgi:hypothetical protein
MGFGRADGAMRFHIICSPVLFSLFPRKGFGWAIRRIDGRGIDAKPEFTKLVDFPDNENHRQRRVLTDQVGERAGWSAGDGYRAGVTRRA